MSLNDCETFSNHVIQPLLTDFYQITMSYAYWKANKKNDSVVFDLYFRKNPFHGEYTIFAGLEECIKFVQNFEVSSQDVEYLKSALPDDTDTGFFDYLLELNARDVILYAVDEGSVVFPRVPLIRVEGPLIICQLLETTLLNLINYASLVATNAARFRMAAGHGKTLLEFGLRRAQGPDGGLSASRYCYMGGFDGTSNVLAGKLYGIPLRGTHAHAYVTSFGGLESLTHHLLPKLRAPEGEPPHDLLSLCLEWRPKVVKALGILADQIHGGELAAFISYAVAFPKNFIALVDTYDVLKTGVPNFCIVALALNSLGYRALGVRIDSGDLAYLSVKVREQFHTVAANTDSPWLANLTIIASNDINEDTIHSLNQQGHSIDGFGIGTHLVTCQKQPALGCVFKMVEINNRATVKLSEDIEKMTIPGRKEVWRLYGQDGTALTDFMQRPEEKKPQINQRQLCRHPYTESKRAYVCPAKVEALYKLYWKDGQVKQPLPTLSEIRTRTLASLKTLRVDHTRALNPTPYKVSVSDQLYEFTHRLWMQSAPIGELS